MKRTSDIDKPSQCRQTIVCRHSHGPPHDHIELQQSRRATLHLVVLTRAPGLATRLRQGGADPAQIQAMLGHASFDTAARYFRAGSAENAEVVERIFSD